MKGQHTRMAADDLGSRAQPDGTAVKQALGKREKGREAEGGGGEGEGGEGPREGQTRHAREVSRD